jgi:hypothetical protein
MNLLKMIRNKMFSMRKEELTSEEFWNKKIELFCEIAKENGYDHFTKEYVKSLPGGLISLVIDAAGKKFPYTQFSGE